MVYIKDKQTIEIIILDNTQYNIAELTISFDV